jgi:hypothetical protein
VHRGLTVPVTIPKAKPEPQALPVAPVEPGLTRAEVQALLDQQAAMFSQQISAVTKAFSGALVAMQAHQKDKPAAGWKFHIDYDAIGGIKSIEATPKRAKE